MIYLSLLKEPRTIYKSENTDLYRGSYGCWGQRKWRCSKTWGLQWFPTQGARGVRSQPLVDAVHVEVVIALRNGPQGLFGLVLAQTYRTGVVAGFGQALAFTKLSLRVGLYGCPIKAHWEEHWVGNCQGREVRAGPGAMVVGFDPSADETWQPDEAQKPRDPYTEGYAIFGSAWKTWKR